MIENGMVVGAQSEYDAQVDGPGGTGTPLIEEFYSDYPVFENWWIDALTSHSQISIECIQSVMDCIRFHREAAGNAMSRGNVMTSARYANTAMDSEAKLGEMVFDMINAFMENASKEAQG